MKVPFYDIRAQYDELKAPLDRAVLEVLASGQYTISGGRVCAELEQELAGLLQVKHAVSVNSGADALHILLDATEIAEGDEVITTGFTFVASAEMIVHTGARPVFVDIAPSTFNIDPHVIEAAITPQTKAIMPIHLFGQLADVEAIQAIAKKHGLMVIEDAAQAIGASHQGIPPGNFGVGAAFSFYVTKNLGAAGDAGLIVTNNDTIAETCRSMRVHGMGRERYYYDHLGYTSRMDEIQATVLRVKLTRLSAWNTRRAHIAKMYAERLGGSGLLLPKVSEGNMHCWHQYVIRCDRRDALMSHLRGREIDSAIFYPVPIHFHEPYRQFGHGEGSLPETERASREVLSLPIHPHLSDEQIEFVAESVLEFVNG